MDSYTSFIPIIVIMLGVIIWLITMTKRKSKYGLNLKAVDCPICATQQPMIRFPKNKNQAFYGGYTCTKCQAELDKYGDVIS